MDFHLKFFPMDLLNSLRLTIVECLISSKGAILTFSLLQLNRHLQKNSCPGLAIRKSKYFCVNVGLSPSKNKCYLLHWKYFKNHEKCFLFHLKSSFCSQDIYVFVMIFWSCTKKDLIRKTKLTWKSMTSQPG